MTDDLNRALAGDDDITPSSGFTMSVMSAVRSAAAAPPPIPFPWRRALPIVAAAALAAGGYVTGLVRLASSSTPLLPEDAVATLERVAAIAATAPVAWVGVAFAVGVAGSLAAMRVESWLPRRTTR